MRRLKNFIPIISFPKIATYFGVNIFIVLASIVLLIIGGIPFGAYSSILGFLFFVIVALFLFLFILANQFILNIFALTIMWYVINHKEKKKVSRWLEDHKLSENNGIRRCNHCGFEPHHDNNAIECPQCGGPIALFKPFIVTCTWCGIPNRGEKVVCCQGCGGDLPSALPGDPGHKPVAPERKLPPIFIRNVLLWQNEHTKSGLNMVLIFFWTVLFFFIGLFELRKGFKKGEQRLHVFETGDSVLGEIIEISEDRELSNHSGYASKVRFRFTYRDTVYESANSGWDVKRFTVGEQVWIVFDKEDATKAEIWPPLL